MGTIPLVLSPLKEMQGFSYMRSQEQQAILGLHALLNYIQAITENSRARITLCANYVQYVN